MSLYYDKIGTNVFFMLFIYKVYNIKNIKVDTPPKDPAKS